MIWRHFVSSIAAAMVFAAALRAADPSGAAAQAIAGQADVDVAFQKLVDAEDWRAERVASDELAACGQPALWTVMRGAKDHEDAKVRRACYELLTHSLANETWAIKTVVRHGLRDEDARIRYVCAFALGEQKAYGAYRRLQTVMDDPNDDEQTRLAAAKSLAQLGEGSLLRRLRAAASSDWYMNRHIGNLGLKGLSGKNLNDFAGYDYAEGAFVSGGAELVRALDPIRDAQNKARRFQAIAAYFTWLKRERTELFKHIAASD
jgi:hypothetical protein